MDYYERNKEKELEYKWDRQVDKGEEARLYVFTYLTEHPCEGYLPDGTKCPEADPYVLTFHHVRGAKKSNVSQMVNQGYSLKLIQEDIPTSCLKWVQYSISRPASNGSKV